MGNIGGFIGPWLIGIIKQRSGSYACGLYVVGAMMALSAVVMLALSGQVERKNTEARGVQ